MPFGLSEGAESRGDRWSDLPFYEKLSGNGGVRWRELMSKDMSKRVWRFCRGVLGQGSRVTLAMQTNGGEQGYPVGACSPIQSLRRPGRARRLQCRRRARL